MDKEKKKKTYSSKHSISSSCREATDYPWPQIPDQTLVFSDQRNGEKIGVQAFDPSPDIGSCKVPVKTMTIKVFWAFGKDGSYEILSFESL